MALGNPELARAWQGADGYGYRDPDDNGYRNADGYLLSEEFDD